MACGDKLYFTVILLCQAESLLLALWPADALQAVSEEGVFSLLVCFGCACVLVCLPRGK